MSDNFMQKLTANIEKRGSLLCIGLDPQMEMAEGADAASVLLDYNSKIIEQTLDYAACYKPNIAFYEQFGTAGLTALEKTLDLIPGDVPVIIDAKRSEIGNSARAYAKSLFGNYKADAVTINGYLGRESVQPFLEYKGRGLFVLCRTSNPGSGVFQELPVCRTGTVCRELYLLLAEEVSGWSPDIGIVVAGNEPAALRAVRAVLPDIWILAPGIGTQGGSVDAAVAAGRGRNDHLLLNVSREIGNAPNPGARAKQFYGEIRKARSSVQIVVSKDSQRLEKRKTLVREIIAEGCFKVGEFKIKSGKISPFYLDLRKIISSPALLYKTAAAYAELMRTLEYDRIAGLPVAAVALATAVSLRLDKPQIFPRLQKKEHGTGNTVEGTYNAGDTAVMLDDLITTGASKLEALQILTEAGLKVTDLAVLVERGKQGRKDMEKAGIRLHAYLTIDDFLDVCLEQGIINREKLAEITAFVNALD